MKKRHVINIINKNKINKILSNQYKSKINIKMKPLNTCKTHKQQKEKKNLQVLRGYRDP